MKHHPVHPVHESKKGSPLQQRVRERNYDLFCLSGISQNLRRIIWRNNPKSNTTEVPRDLAPRLDKVTVETLDLIEGMVKRSYDEFKRKYDANQSSK